MLENQTKFRFYEIAGATSNPESCDLENLECPSLDSDQIGLEAIRWTMNILSFPSFL